MGLENLVIKEALQNDAETLRWIEANDGFPYPYKKTAEDFARYMDEGTKFGSIIGKNVRITISANFMPRIKIGANCFVGSHVNLDRDLELGTYCYAKQDFQVRENDRKLSDRALFRKKLENIATK